MAPPIAIRPVPFRPSLLSLPTSPPFTPRSPIHRQVRRMKKIPPAIPRYKIATPTPLPWTWTCHMCNARYPLGATQRCLSDSHLFCSGTSKVLNKRAKLKIKFHGPGVHCESAFDYKTWRKIGMERERERESLQKRGLAGLSGRGIMQKRDCWGKCWSPSECRHGRKAVERALGIDPEEEMMALDATPLKAEVGCKVQNSCCSDNAGIGIAITLPDLVAPPARPVLVSDEEEDERMRQEFEKLVDFDIPATESIERPFSFAPILIRKTSYDTDSDSDSDSSITSDSSGSSASTALTVPNSAEASPEPSPILSSARIKPPVDKPAAAVPEPPPPVAKDEAPMTAPKRTNNNSTNPQTNPTRLKISAPIPLASTVESTNKMKCDIIAQPLIFNDVKELHAPIPRRSAFQENKSAAATRGPRVVRRNRSISPKSNSSRRSSASTTRRGRRSPPPPYPGSPPRSEREEPDRRFVIDLEGVSPRDTQMSQITQVDEKDFAKVGHVASVRELSDEAKGAEQDRRTWLQKQLESLKKMNERRLNERRLNERRSRKSESEKRGRRLNKESRTAVPVA